MILLRGRLDRSKPSRLAVGKLERDLRRTLKPGTLEVDASGPLQILGRRGLALLRYLEKRENDDADDRFGGGNGT